MEKLEIVKSRDNAHVKLFTGLLSRKKERERTGCFALEGLRLVADAAASGVPLRVLLVTEEALERHPEVAALAEAAERTVLLSGELAERIGDTKTPQGVFAVCGKQDNPTRTLDNGQSAVTIKSGGNYLLLCSVRDPGNLGSAIRTAEALGMDGVFVSADCADPYGPKALRASMGGIFRLPVEIGGDLLAEIGMLRDAGVPVYAAALTDGAALLNRTDFSRGGAVVVGNEGAGLPEAIIAACDSGVVIPMAGRADSLGAAVAAGILLWEMRRGRDGGTELW